MKALRPLGKAVLWSWHSYLQFCFIFLITLTEKIQLVWFPTTVLLFWVATVIYFVDLLQKIDLSYYSPHNRRQFWNVLQCLLWTFLSLSEQTILYFQFLSLPRPSKAKWSKAGNWDSIHIRWQQLLLRVSQRIHRSLVCWEQDISKLTGENKVK